MSTGANGARAGVVGLPAPGLDLKLVPGRQAGSTYARPNITPGYWGDEALTRAAFDAEGYCCLGDAMRFVDSDDPGEQLMFDGRLAEDFSRQPAGPGDPTAPGANRGRRRRPRAGRGYHRPQPKFCGCTDLSKPGGVPQRRRAARDRFANRHRPDSRGHS